MQNLSINADDSLYIRVIGFALKYPQGFKYRDIIESKEINLKEWEKNIIDRHFLDALIRYRGGQNTIGETVFLFIHGNIIDHKSTDNDYLVNIDAEFKFLDYQELKFARANAREAKRLSLWAIVLSGVAIIMSAIVPFLVTKYITQNITVDNDQLQDIKYTIDSLTLQNIPNLCKVLMLK